MERVDRGVTAGGEGNPIWCGHQQHAAGPEYASALGHELPLIPKVFDDLEVDHHIDLAVGQRELGEIPVPHLHPRIPGPYMRDGRLVVIQPDHPACHTSDQVGSVTLAAAGLEHVESDATTGQSLVDDLMATEPVVLLRQPRDRAFARKGQRIVPKRTVGNE